MAGDERVTNVSHQWLGNDVRRQRSHGEVPIPGNVTSGKHVRRDAIEWDIFPFLLTTTQMETLIVPTSGRRWGASSLGRRVSFAKGIYLAP